MYITLIDISADFITYINDLTNISTICITILYVDDINLIFASNTLSSLSMLINIESSKISAWLAINKLTSM